MCHRSHNTHDAERFFLSGTYYAAQQGIALGAKDPAVRGFLFELLDLLERVKAEIGKNDAITDDAASAAYVENFALRVFANADNEDRKGGSTRFVADIDLFDLPTLTYRKMSS